jgi:hypothetical protein
LGQARGQWRQHRRRRNEPAVTQRRPGPGDAANLDVLPSFRSRTSSFVSRFTSQVIVAAWQQVGPFVLSTVLLLLGYVYYLPGTEYSLSAEHYRDWAFPAFRYSDLVWLYLRDGLEHRPVPYVDYLLEYPPLTGLLSWLVSWATDLPAYFSWTYLILAGSSLASVWALQRIYGANPWLFAAAPALFFYTGHQWDMAAIGVAAVSLVAMQRGREGWGVFGLAVATSLKLFPVVFVAGAMVERLRNRQYRSAMGIGLVFGIWSLLFNLPVALSNVEGWSFFFRWNRDRLADSGLWVLWRDAPTTDLTRWSLIAAFTGGLALTMLALRARGPVTLPLGATYLLWWLLVNKTFTTHLMLWVMFSLAILSAPWWLWGLTVAIDVVGFQLGNYLNLYNISDFRHAPLIRKAVENIYDPFQLARSAVLFACTCWGIARIQNGGVATAYRAPPHLGIVSRVAVSGSANLPLHVPWKCVLPAARLGAVVGLAFTALTVVMTWPYAVHLTDSTIVGFDPLLQIWLSEWIHHALLTNPLGLYQANIFYPFSQTLAYTDANIPGALVAAPLRLLTDDVILTNSLLVLGSFVVAGTGVYAVVDCLTKNRAAGLVSGIMYAFLPYRMVHLWHLNWLEGALLPWLLLALVQLLERPTIVRGVLLGVLAGTLILTSFYFALQILLVCGVVALAKSIAFRAIPSPELAKSVGVSVLVAVVITVPLLLPYLEVQKEQRLERTIVDAEQYKALPGSYWQLAPWDLPNALQRTFGLRAGPNESLSEVGQGRHADGHQHAEIVIEDALYPGALAVGFACVGVAFSRRYRWLAIALAVVALIAILLSFGPSFGPRHGSGMPLPYGWLFDHVPFFRSMRVPARLGGLANLMLVLLAGFGIAATWSRIRLSKRLRLLQAHFITAPLLTTFLSALVLIDLWTGAIPLEPVDMRPEAGAAALWIATQPAGPVMEFPVESVFADPAAASVRRHYGETMFWSTLHWQPLVNGNSGFIPRAYSDFIERFVGTLQRPDGTFTPRISHLNAGTARLLQQIGVRYVVFLQPRYQAEDWLAITGELNTLAETGMLTAAGQHGDSLVFLVNPAVPAIEAPRVSLFAPTLLTPDSAWAPWVAIKSLGDLPSVLALTQPPRLETTWFDAQGRLLAQDVRAVPLPAVLEDPWLLCGKTDCMTSRPFDDPSRLPPPEVTGSWVPQMPGHYVVKLRLFGDQPLECRVDLDLVAYEEEVAQRSPGERYRWATCIKGHLNPVNNPGALPFALSPPSVTLVENESVLDIAITPRQDEEVRGWFILAPPGSAQPWRESVYRSPVQQKLLSAGELEAFEWRATVGSDVEPGVYGLTVWFHRRGLSGWEHAAGGDVQLAPIIVGKDHAIRWAGPIRIRATGMPPLLVAGQANQIELQVSGDTSNTNCHSNWRLSSGDDVKVSGNAGECSAPEITLPASVLPGPYRLQIDAYEDRNGSLTLSDAVSLPVFVTGSGHAGSPT